MGSFFRPALADLDSRIRLAARIALGSEGAISYGDAIKMGLYESSCVIDEIERFGKEQKKRMKDARR